jgi:lysophospholipase
MIFCSGQRAPLPVVPVASVTREESETMIPSSKSEPSLIGTGNNPIPPGAACASVTTLDGRRLRAATFTPLTGWCRGTVVLLQGRSEFIEKYFETITELLARGYCVATFDWRGQGGSERELLNRRKGHVAGFALYQYDLQAVISYLQGHSKFNHRAFPSPWFALAHSMGGAILVEHAHAHSGHTPFERLILTAPMIELALPLRGAVRLLARGLNTLGLGERFAPGGKDASNLEGDFKGNKLTSDPARFARAAAVLASAPELAVGDPTIGWLDAAFRQMERFEERDYPWRIRVPSLFFACRGDRVVSASAIQHFVGRTPCARIAHIAGCRHEILIERDEYRAQFWDAFDDFVADPNSRRRPVPAHLVPLHVVPRFR